jgi:hypothetical protein
VDGSELIRRVELLYGIEDADLLRMMWNARESEEMAARWAAAREVHHGRMHDLSVFMKLLKQRFTMWYNYQHRSKGTLWTERFKSVLVESTQTRNDPLRLVAAYIEMNPVRAGLVERPSQYAFSGRVCDSLTADERLKWMAIDSPLLVRQPGLVKGGVLGGMNFVLDAVATFLDLRRQMKLRCLGSGFMRDLYVGRRYRSE